MSPTSNQPLSSEESPDAAPIFLKSFDMVLRVLEHTKKYPEHQRLVLLVLAERTEATKTRRRRDARLQAEFHLGLTRGARPGRGLPWLDHGARGTTA